MLIAFHHHEPIQWSQDEIDLQRKCAELMIASVKRTTPGAEFAQITDMETPALVDRVTRYVPNGNRCADACKQHADLPPDTVILDTDVIVLADLAELLIPGADLIVTHRRNPERKIAGRYMPYLFGVCVSREAGLWLDMRERVSKMTGDDARWWGLQIALHGMVADGRWNIQSVPCDVWNYTPKAGESVEGRKALHYKGKRKALMVQEWGAHA
jgi:hypothetical protein